MRHPVRLIHALLALALVVPVPALAQTEPAQAAAPVRLAPVELLPVVVPAKSTPRPFSSIFSSLGGDFGRLVTPRSLLVLGAGGALATAVRPADRPVVMTLARDNRVEEVLDPGSTLGSGEMQVGAAFGTWAIGKLVHRPAVQNLGADLLEAQIVAATLTHGLKFAVGRTRPDGTQFSFPSGHSSASFATADILQQHFGWKVGLPAYALAGYVGTSRMSENRHFLSDVIFGAAIGIASARSLSIGTRNARFAVTPVPTQGGAAIMVTAIPKR
ncbi:MAG TPA: phosphatase PAP2 family protein [Vicinamibacterales bacterium]|nr:phosphatase PAP2 family protein [Vicinamibacterales bacterium]